MKRLFPIAGLVFALASPVIAAAAGPADSAAAKKAPAPPLPWQVQQKRQALFEEGQKLVDKDKWSEALEKFREVDGIRSHPRVILWMALCEEHLGHLLEAKDLYLKAQEQAREGKMADVEKEATEALRELAPKVPLVALRISPVIDAEVLVDGNKVTPLDGGVHVDPGKHVVLVRASGRKEYRAEVILAQGEEKSLAVSLVEDPPARPLPPPVPPDRTPATGSIAFLVAGGALLVAGGPMLASGIAHDSNGLKGFGSGFLVGSAACLGVGIPWAITSSSRSAPATPAATVAVSAAPLPGGAAFGVHGTF